MTLIDEILLRPVLTLPDDVLCKITQAGHITPLARHDATLLATDAALQDEIGVCPLPSGGWLAAMKSDMPYVTAEMIPWWFWWHTQDSKRYQMWYPGEHFSISVKEKELFSGEYTGFPPCTHYPKERVGGTTATLSIQFVKPTEFGITNEMMRQNGIVAVICGHVGILHGLIQHTEMIHIFKQEADGLSIISRFWMGERLPKFVQKMLFTKEQAQGMATHCCIEYRRLADILPLVYDEMQSKKQSV